MPPIDLMHLLNLLRVFLNKDTGGLKGPTDAITISRLMTKFSKNIVCKTLYVFILKESTPQLLNVFVNAGGWNLIYNWLKGAVEVDNINLIQDLLTIYHNISVTMEHLKANGVAKLVKNLSKTHINTEVNSLAQQLVKKWIIIVEKKPWHSMNDKKSLTKQEISDSLKSETEGHLNLSVPKIDSGVSADSISDGSTSECENDTLNDRIKNGKPTLNNKVELEKEKIKDNSDDAKEKNNNKKKNVNQFYTITGEMNDEDKQTKIDNSNLTKHSNKRKQNLKNLSPVEKCLNLKLSNDNKKNFSGSNPSLDIKKETRLLQASAPKPNSFESKTILEKKNYSIQIEKKDYVGEKKLTVKTYKSKFRSTGLEEQALPLSQPKSTAKLKKQTNSFHLSNTENRSWSPLSDSPSKKKLKISSSDTKNLPSKIKDSGMFMDSILSVIKSAPKVSKKQIAKPDAVKKNRDFRSATTLSPVKSDYPSPPMFPEYSPSKPNLISLVLPQPLSNADESQSFFKSIMPSDYVPESAEKTPMGVTPKPLPELNVEQIIEKPPQLKFYRDTLLDSTNESLTTDEPEEKTRVKSPIEESTTNNCNDQNSMKNAVQYVRNKSSNKLVSWRQENDLVKVCYFELNKTDRDAGDNMKPKTPWRYLDDSLLIEVPEEPGKEKIEHGSGSQEKKIQTLREQSILQVLYFTRNMVPNSPEEPDQTEQVSFSRSLNRPLEDTSGDNAYEFVYDSWPPPKNDQPPIEESPIGINNVMSMPNMMIPQPQFPGFVGYNMNCNMPPENRMAMAPGLNNMYIPPNSTMMNNQIFVGNQMQQLPQLLQQQTQYHPPSLVQENQWMSPTRPPMQYNQNLGQQQSHINNGPPHFDRKNSDCGHTRWNNTRDDYYNSYQGKMDRNNQQGNIRGSYNRRGGYPNNRRVGGRLCKYYAKFGSCKISNCCFLHQKF